MPQVFDDTKSATTFKKRTTFDQAFNQHWQTIYTQAYRKLQSNELAKDLTQDVFIVLWNNLAEMKSHETLLPYLYGVLRNKVFKQYEKDAVRLRYAVSIAGNELADEWQPEELLQHKQLHSIVNDEIARMPPRMKEIYLLKKESNLPVHEIAGKLNIAEQTVKNQLRQGYTRLRVRLKNYPISIILIAMAACYP